MILVLFLFKQKTAYDMRISDWISDVFSSDLTSSPTAPPSPSQSPPRKDRSTTGHINTTITVTTSAAREPLNHTVAALTAATPSQNQCHFASMRDQMNGISASPIIPVILRTLGCSVIPMNRAPGRSPLLITP